MKRPAWQPAGVTTQFLFLTEEGTVRACGDGRDGQLGHGNRRHELVPARLGMQALGGRRAVMVAAGWEHTAAAMQDGTVYTWGRGVDGERGHGNTQDMLVPTVLEIASFGGIKGIMGACGSLYTAVLGADDGTWTFGSGGSGLLGHGYEVCKLVPTRIDSAHFHGSRMAMVAAGGKHTIRMVPKAKETRSRGRMVRCWRVMYCAHHGVSQGMPGQVHSLTKATQPHSYMSLLHWVIA